MPESWDIALAKKFKDRDNKVPIGNIVGKVISTFPDLKISILDGQIILSKEQLYISTFLESNYNREYQINSITGTITFLDTLKVNDDVLLSHTANEHMWFIIAKVRKLG
jgi:hypothetical protein